MTKLSSIPQHQLSITCGLCKHHTMLEVANLIAVVGGDTTAHEVRQRARCHNCGVKGNNTYQIKLRGWRVSVKHGPCKKFKDGPRSSCRHGSRVSGTPRSKILGGYGDFIADKLNISINPAIMARSEGVCITRMYGYFRPVIVCNSH